MLDRIVEALLRRATTHPQQDRPRQRTQPARRSSSAKTIWRREPPPLRTGGRTSRGPRDYVADARLGRHDADDHARPRRGNVKRATSRQSLIATLGTRHDGVRHKVPAGAQRSRCSRHFVRCSTTPSATVARTRQVKVTPRRTPPVRRRRSSNNEQGVADARPRPRYPRLQSTPGAGRTDSRLGLRFSPAGYARPRQEDTIARPGPGRQLLRFRSQPLPVAADGRAGGVCPAGPAPTSGQRRRSR